MKSLFLEVNPSQRGIIVNSNSQDELSHLNSIFSENNQSTNRGGPPINKNKQLEEAKAIKLINLKNNSYDTLM
jgi:hypothetical protein